MDRSDLQRLMHIKTHCDDVADFIARFGDDYDMFVNDRVYFNAVAMSILQVGELANGLSEEFRKETERQIPWHMIRGMRNLLAHAYGEIDEAMLWDTARLDIPKVGEFCDSYISSEKK